MAQSTRASGRYTLPGSRRDQATCRPSTYLSYSAFAGLQHRVESAAGQFTGRWLDAPPDMPEIRMLKTVRDFLADPDGFQARVNNTFVVNELSRPRSLFDRIENDPLQRNSARPLSSTIPEIWSLPLQAVTRPR